MVIYIDEMDSPIGPLTFAVKDEGLCYIEYGSFGDKKDYLTRWAEKHFGEVVLERNSAKVEKAKTQLQEYFDGKRIEFTIPLSFYGTPFQTKVWKALLTIPFGKTASYKDMAIKIDSPKAVRAVGGAVNRNPLSIIVPCHRVIGSNGALVGYNGGLDKKEFLLHHENAKVK